MARVRARVADTHDWQDEGMSGELAIRLRRAVKRYGPITAVDGLDLDVPYGTCVGLLGPNGAGKSTTMRLLTAQAIADEGELEVLGFRLPDESKQARALCGVVPQLDNLEEAQRLADSVVIMSHGNAVAVGRPSELVATHAGREAVEVYGPPAKLVEVEAEAGAAGFCTRRTGTSISVLGIEGADGRAPEGERRPANLEDVFVLLTGEEID